MKIIVIEAKYMQDGEGILMLSTKDYAEYAENLKEKLNE